MTENPINLDTFIWNYHQNLLSYDERYFEWFEYICMLLDFCKSNGIDNIKFFTMSNNFSKKYLEEGKTPPFYHTPKSKSVWRASHPRSIAATARRTLKKRK